MNATPKKLRDGTWGARVEGERPEPDTIVTIVTLRGKTWNAVIIDVVSSEGGAHVCRTRSAEPRPARPIAVRFGDKTFYRNASGSRCLDAPCCGCCTI